MATLPSFSKLHFTKTPPTLLPIHKPPLSVSLSKASRLTPLSVSLSKASTYVIGTMLLISRLNHKPALASTNLPRTPTTNMSTPLDQQQQDEAMLMYEKILEKNPRDVEAVKVLLYGKMKKGRTAEAVKYVERLIKLEPREVEWKLLEALSWELMGNVAKAKRLFRDILKREPLLIRALHGLAIAMHKNHESPAAFEMLNRALELAQREKRVTEERNIKILIAQMHVVTGDLEEALKKFQELVKEDPRDFRPYLCQGIIYSLLKKEKEAEEQFEVYRTLLPEEFPQQGFINDVILAAKTESQASSKARQGV